MTVNSPLPPDIGSRIVERLRTMTPAQRFQQMMDLTKFVTDSQLEAVRATYPDADEFEIRLRAASRWVRNPELLKGAFGWDVEVQGY